MAPRKTSPKPLSAAASQLAAELRREGRPAIAAHVEAFDRLSAAQKKAAVAALRPGPAVRNATEAFKAFKAYIGTELLEAARQNTATAETRPNPALAKQTTNDLVRQLKTSIKRAQSASVAKTARKGATTGASRVASAKPAKAQTTPKAMTKGNPKAVEELAAKFNAAIGARGNRDLINQVKAEIEAAKLTKADKIALARATGSVVPSSASGKQALQAVTGRLANLSTSIARGLATAGRIAGALTLVAAGASLLLGAAARSDSAMAALVDPPEPKRTPSQPLPPFEVNRAPTSGSGAMTSPAALRTAPAQPTAYLNAVAQAKAERSSVHPPMSARTSRLTAVKPNSDGFTEGYTRADGTRVRGYRTPQR